MSQPNELLKDFADKQVWINGEFVPALEASVSVFDHGLLYGDGVFEGIRVYGGNVFLNDQHVDRLYEGARSIRLEVPYSAAELTAALKDTVSRNSITDGYIRLVVTRGAGYLGIDPARTRDPQVIIIAGGISLYPDEYYRDGLKLVTASTIRNHSGALSPRIKSLNYLNNVMAKIEGKDAGSVEALMLNHKGEVSECTGDNIFIVRNGELMTPPRDAGILEGITRNHVICLARDAGLTVHEASMVRHDIYIADECFLTGTAAEVIPVVSLDGRPIGAGKPGPVTENLLGLFRRSTTA